MGILDLFRSKRHPFLDPRHIDLTRRLGRMPGKRYFHRSRWLPHQGLRECARRLRQAGSR
ncbi:hypothetical protein NKH91_17545 [Mesorhizobium sp. M0894]|uniref:hypothetical protein n=1 Tax=unclassified Mesorhizobium TaxID=325217 RepID=UPI00333BA91D